MKKEKKLSTILGIILILGLVVSLVFLKNVRTLLSGASEETIPQDVKVTNITDNSFVVSWITAKRSSGIVGLVDNGGERLFPDIRSKTGELGDYDTHYVEVNGLESDKEYEFVVMSQGERFYQSRERPYQTRTAKALVGELPRANLASGRVVELDGNPAAGAVVYVSINGIASLSSLVTNQGNWVISLSKAFSSDLVQLADYQEGAILEEILVQGGGTETATALVYTRDDDPVPTITLGSQHDFTTQEGATITPTPASNQASRFESNGKISSPKQFKIINPGDGEVIGFPRPEILGTGPEGGKLKITLESPITYEAEVEIDDSGEWQWTPPQDLTPGVHTLTINYTDPQTGEEESFIRTFVLSAASDDDGPSFAATPSGATVTPTASPTATLTTTPTGSPTATLAPTAPPRTSQPSTESGVPQPGLWEPTLILIGGAMLLFLILGLNLIF